MVEYLSSCGLPMSEENFDWDKHKVVSLKVPGRRAHDIADQLGEEFFTRLGPISPPRLLAPGW